MGLDKSKNDLAVLIDVKKALFTDNQVFVGQKSGLIFFQSIFLVGINRKDHLFLSILKT